MIAATDLGKLFLKIPNSKNPSKGRTGINHTISKMLLIFRKLKRNAISSQLSAISRVFNLFSLFVFRKYSLQLSAEFLNRFPLIQIPTSTYKYLLIKLSASNLIPNSKFLIPCLSSAHSHIYSSAHPQPNSSTG